jgi:hypothetical protein
MQVTKEWCIRMAQLEGDAEIGVGMSPLRDIGVLEDSIGDRKIAILDIGYSGADMAAAKLTGMLAGSETVASDSRTNVE